MNKTLNALALSGAIALGFVVGSYGNAEAGVLTRDSAVVSHADATAQLVKVQHRHHRHWRHHRPHRHWRHHRRHYRGGSSFFFGFGTPYYVRPHYVRPPVYVRPRYVAPRGLSRAHIRWCYNRYRSYRASDNTFQPYHGPRRQCYSPYR